jgi:uncharacterized membrane protein YoaK (UPF0700 family)
MLSASAYSFRLKSRLAISLSWIAGYTNVITFLVCGVVTSHATGHVTHLGEWVGKGRLREAAFFAFLITAFLLGAVFSAVLTESARRAGHQSKYILPMMVQAALLSLFAVGIERHIVLTPEETFTRYWMTGLACFSMGLQNATVTSVSGAVVRTTHLTGVLTDIGIEGVRLVLWYADRLRWNKRHRAGRLFRLSTQNPGVLRVLLLASILGSFLFGTVAGTIAFGRWPHYALAAPVLFLLWIVLVDWYKPIADVRELDPLSDPDLAHLKEWLPPELGVYRMAHHRGDRLHHAPDFQMWFDRVPRQWRGVILLVSPWTRFDVDAAADLAEAARKMKAQRRGLIVCGLRQNQYQSLEDAGVVHVIGAANICPDIELAIARGMNLLAELNGSAANR